ncbi:hypothetical protein C9J21_03730 [Photobacterium phosphoreum]|nr:hypothetical protein C9J21_03730 [Photobacterium phosphoreum]
MCIRDRYKLCKVSDFEIKAYIYALYSSLIFFAYYYMTFEAIRDGIATAIILYSISYIVSGKFKSYYIIVLLSLLFHQASIFFIIPALLYRYVVIKKISNYYILFLFVFASSFFLKDFILNLNFINEHVKYLLSYYAENKSNSNTVVVRYIIILSFCLFYLHLTRRDFGNKGRGVHIYLIFTVISFSFFAAFPDMYRRLLLKVEFISYPIIIISYLSMYKTKKSYLTYSLFLILYYVLFMSNYHSYYSLLNIRPLFEL